MILTKCEKNKVYIIEKISVSTRDRQRLFKLGLKPKERFVFCEKIFGGGRLILHKGSLICIGKNLSKLIEVKKLSTKIKGGRNEKSRFGW